MGELRILLLERNGWRPGIDPGGHVELSSMWSSRSKCRREAGGRRGVIRVVMFD